MSFFLCLLCIIFLLIYAAFFFLHRFFFIVYHFFIAVIQPFFYLWMFYVLYGIFFKYIYNVFNQYYIEFLNLLILCIIFFLSYQIKSNYNTHDVNVGVNLYMTLHKWARANQGGDSYYCIAYKPFETNCWPRHFRHDANAFPILSFMYASNHMSVSIWLKSLKKLVRIIGCYIISSWSSSHNDMNLLFYCSPDRVTAPCRCLCMK